MATLANPSIEMEDAWGATPSVSGERVTEKKAMGLAAVFSAVEKISEAIGSLPLKVYRTSDDNDREEARAHRSWKLLHDKPNDYTTAHALWSAVSAQLLLGGNSYLWKQYDDEGVVESLYLIHPQAIQRVEISNGQKVFVVLDGMTERRFGPEQILHIMGFSLDGLTGCSRITYCRETLGTALGRSRFEGEFYGQGAQLRGVIEYPGRLGKEGTAKLAQAMRDRHHQPGRRFLTPVLEEGATFKPISMSLEDMQFVEGAQLSRSDIATMFNLPAAYLNASSGDSLTYATTESNQIQFVQMAIAPITNRIAKAVSTDPELLPQNVMYAEFVLEGVLRADMKTRAEYYKTMKEVLNLDPAWIAARENIPQDALKPEPKPVAPPQMPPGELPMPPVRALPPAADAK